MAGIYLFNVQSTFILRKANSPSSRKIGKEKEQLTKEQQKT